MEDKRLQVYESLVNEITKGMGQVKQLRASSSRNQEAMLERMLSSHEEALSILNGSSSVEQCESVVSSTSTPTDSSVSVWKVALSEEVSSRHPDPRKLFSRITEQVSVNSLSGSIPDDGYIWRKYGQKDILNSLYPRSYYRCTHRFDRGCTATKQVQKSSDDPTMYVVTYRGQHTCLKIEPVVPQLASTGETGASSLQVHLK